MVFRCGTVVRSDLVLPQLVKSGDPEKKAVAEFHPHQRHFLVFRMSKHAFFEVQPIPEITDAIDKFIGTPYMWVLRRTVDSCRVFVSLFQ